MKVYAWICWRAPEGNIWTNDGRLWKMGLGPVGIHFSNKWCCPNMCCWYSSRSSCSSREKANVLRGSQRAAPPRAPPGIFSWPPYTTSVCVSKSLPTRMSAFSVGKHILAPTIILNMVSTQKSLLSEFIIKWTSLLRLNVITSKVLFQLLVPTVV